MHFLQDPPVFIDSYDAEDDGLSVAAVQSYGYRST
jgi:hypothetical protein